MISANWDGKMASLIAPVPREPRIVRSDSSMAVGLTHVCPSLHPTQYPWVHERFNKTFDHAA